MPNHDGEKNRPSGLESWSVTVARLRLKLAPTLPAPRVDHLRAAIALVKPELDLLHQHGRNGLIYRYPRVIYRVVDQDPTIIAVEEGIDVLSALTLVGAELRFGAFTHRIVEANLDIDEHAIGPSYLPCHYYFTAPWLALNQENHARFERMDAKSRWMLLHTQIANNCLSLAKSFGLRITTRLTGFANVRPVPVRFKNVEMLGFLGEFDVNFNIPEGLGLGKSVSKGFGAARRLH